jgi:trans-aconitate methyltransferase
MNDHVITGNYFDKYGSANPLVRWLVRQYLETLYGLLERHPVAAVLDAGCGEGEIVRRIVERYDPPRLVGLDIDSRLIEHLRCEYPDHDFRTGTLEDYYDSEPYDVVLCLEVLEHIPDYRAALNALGRLSTRRFIISVPNEPFFRLANVARLRYLSRGGNTPGHVNNFTARRFGALLRDAFPDALIDTHQCYIWSFGHVERPAPKGD